MNLPSKCGVCFFITVSLFAQSPVGGAGDEAAIREVVKKYMDARGNSDAGAIRSLFTTDADQLVSSGEWRKGRNEVVQGALESSRRSGGKRTITVASVRLVAPEVALVDGQYELTGLADGESRKMWTSLLLLRGPEGWRITAIRNMLPAAPAPSK